ncbi:MAG: hypothetical protein F4X77_09180 [Acidobacteriia bacterium]|nr:hypothetical protein [Terriglobia bacterium]MYC65777.1 hypothetical protein [Terriglobia bacterium]
MPTQRCCSDFGPYGIWPVATARGKFFLFQQLVRRLQQQPRHFQHYPQHVQQFLRNVEQQLRDLQQFLR